MLAVTQVIEEPLSDEAAELLALLRDDSPQSTKQLRREAGLTGRPSELLWTRSMRELWERCLTVGVGGEVDDGAFSLAVEPRRPYSRTCGKQRSTQPKEAALRAVNEALGRTSPAIPQDVDAEPRKATLKFSAQRRHTV